MYSTVFLPNNDCTLHQIQGMNALLPRQAPRLRTRPKYACNFGVNAARAERWLVLHENKNPECRQAFRRSDLALPSPLGTGTDRDPISRPVWPDFAMALTVPVPERERQSGHTGRPASDKISFFLRENNNSLDFLSQLNVTYFSGN